MNRFRFPELLREQPDAPGGGQPPAADPAAANPATSPATPPAANPATPPAADPATPGPEGEAKGGDAKDPYAWIGVDLTDKERASLDATKTDSPAKMYQRMRHAEKQLRGGAIDLPPESAEGLSEWWGREDVRKAMGVGAEVKDYSFDPPEPPKELKPFYAHLDVVEESLRETAREIGVPKHMYQKLHAAFHESQQKALAAELGAASADRLQVEQGLAGEWGDQFEDRMRLAVEKLGEFGLDETAVESLRRAEVIGGAALLKMAHALGAVTAEEGGLVRGGAGGDPHARMTQTEAKAALEEFSKVHGAAITKTDHPDHALRKQEYMRLMQRVHPTGGGK